MRSDDERNQNQIIRKDGKNCFVESKSDSFAFGKAHLEFATYDLSRPQGSRFTNHVHIYIDMADFLELTNEALNGYLHTQMQRMKQILAESAKNPSDTDLKAQAYAPLYETLGGTAAKNLQKPRSDGMSQSRCMKLLAGTVKDYLLKAESGPGSTTSKGLIVPKFGNKPEEHVSVAMDWRSLTQLLLMTKVHYEAWLTAEYHSQKSNGSTEGSVGGIKVGKNVADDTQMY